MMKHNPITHVNEGINTDLKHNVIIYFTNKYKTTVLANTRLKQNI